MIDLPDTPGPVSAEPALIDFGATLTPPLGGEVQQVARMGSRYRIAVTMPPMRHEPKGRIWTARLVRGKIEGVRMPLPMMGFDPGAPGDPVVDGAGQTGTSLSIRGATPHYQFREGQYFSILTGGRHHLVMVAEPVIVGADGTADLPIVPMIRVAHADGDALHVGQPMIEGRIDGDEFGWSWSLANFVGLSFGITESA